MTVGRFALAAVLLGSLPAAFGCSSAHVSQFVPSPTLTNPQQYSVATMEGWYDSAFCQLTVAGTSWQSPQCQQNVAFIAGQPQTGHFNLNDHPIVNNGLGVTGTTFTALAYNTTVSLPGGARTFHVSGALAMPVGINKSKLKGVVVFFHGTQVDNSSVPSQLSAETKLVISIFTSNGYVVALPDYIGQGIDYADVHPYVLYPTVSAQTAVDLLSAALPSITSQYGLTNSDKLNLFSAGYSEGGAYSLWFYTYLNSHPNLVVSPYVLTHSVGDEGAYNLSQVTAGYIFSDVNKTPNTYRIQNQDITNIAKPILTADTILSFATYSLNANYAEAFNPGFFALTCTFPNKQSKCEIGGKQLNMLQALTLQAGNPGNAILSSAENKSTGTYKYPSPVKILTSGKNNATALVATVNLPKLPVLLETEQAADVNLSQVGTNAVSIVSLEDDSVVTPNNFLALVSTYPQQTQSHVLVDQTALLVAQSNPINHKPFYSAPDHGSATVYELPYDLGILNSIPNGANVSDLRRH